MGSSSFGIPPQGFSGILGSMSTINIFIDGGGSAITTGDKAYHIIDFGFTISGWEIVSDQAGSISIDIYQGTSSQWPLTSSQSITNTNYPGLSAQSYNSGNVTNWSKTTIPNGSFFIIHVISATTITKATLKLKIYRNS